MRSRKMNTNSKKYKLAVIASHPIQYQVPLFKEIAKHPNIDLTVFFCSDFGLKEYEDKGFGQRFKWDIPLLDGYKYEFLKNYSPFSALLGFWGLVNFDIVKKLKNGNFDAVWIHGWNSFINWLVMIFAFLIDIPVLLRGESNLLCKIPSWKKALKSIVHKNIFKRMSGFLAIGKYNIEFYKHYGVPEEKIFLTPYAVNNNYFTNKSAELLPEKDKIKQKYNIPENIPAILFCGKLISVKRPLDLLKAYAKILGKIKVFLMYAGDGSLKDELKDYADEHKIKNVYFLGFKNQSELPEIYAMSDVLVLPSEHEPWGLVVNEAMCFGLPVIVSDKVGAGGDLVREGVNGFIYPVGNINTLSGKISTLLSDSKLRKQMGEESLKIIRNWSYEQDVSGILGALNKSVGRN